MTLVFDLGGVVFRWQPDEFLVRLLPQRVPDAAAARAFGAAFFEGFGGEWAEFDRGRIEASLLAERAAVRVGMPVAEARRLIDAIPDELRPIPETVDLLQRLHGAGHRLCFLSNMPLSYAAHLEARHDVLALFECGVFSSRVGRVKPDAAMFTLAAEQFGAAPGELLLIDDNAQNVVAAQRSGWQALRFEDAGQCEAELRRRGRL